MKKYIGLSPLTLGSIKFLLLSILLVGCINEDLSDVGLATKTSTLQLNILANSDFSTRAETTSEIIAEQYITRGYIFVFSADGNTQKSNYTLDASSDIQSNGDNLPIIKAPIKIVAGEKVAVVLNTAPASGLNLATVTLATIDANFPLGNQSNKGFEVVANTTDKTGGLPMYGIHTWSDTPEGNKVIVQRSVAKIQVALAETVGGSNSAGFTTSNITYQLHNYAINGKLKPSDTEGNLNYSDQNQAPISTIADNVITTPTASASDNFIGARYIYEYKYSTNIIGASGSTTQDLKLPTKNRLAIILYNKQTIEYYRLDLCRLGPIYTDIVRNHHYKLIIKSVNSLGYSTAQAALDGAPNNIEYEIVDETGNSTISNSEYAISVGEQPSANKIVYGLIDNGIQTCQVATNVRYIARDGAELPISPNTITVVDANGIPIPSASVTPNVLTDQLASLSITLPTAKNLPSVRFKIQLGTLEFFSTPFSLKCFYSVILNYDCHQLDTRTIHHKYSDIAWDVDPTSIFNITNKTDVSFDITPKSENVTPVSWEKWDDASSTYIPSIEAEVSAIPIFAELFVSTGTKAGIKGDVIIIQRFSPFYIGRWGSPIDGVVNATGGDYVGLTGTMDQPLRKRAIVEALEETRSMMWGSTTNPSPPDIAHHGLHISTIGTPHAGSKVEHYALNACYKKNKNTTLSVDWYLPAQQQLAGVWVVLNNIGYDGQQAFSNKWYWSASEDFSEYSFVTLFGAGQMLLMPIKSEKNSNGVRCIRDL